jgi:predicted O-linked N-acetylglucosamine transferase (SPINDLY family)
MKIVFINHSAGAQSAIRSYGTALSSLGHDVDVFSKTSGPEVAGKIVFKPLDSAPSPSAPPADLVICTGTFDPPATPARLRIAWIFETVGDAGDLSDHLYDFDAFAFVSDWLRKKFIQMYGIEQERTLLMPIPIEPIVGSTEKKPYFACEGLAPEVWRSILEKWPTAQLRVHEPVSHELRDLSGVVSVSASDWTGCLQESAFFLQVEETTVVESEALLSACAAGCIPIINDFGSQSTYFDTCLISNKTLIDQVVSTADQNMKLYTESSTQFQEQSNAIRTFFTKSRNVERLVAEFISSVQYAMDLRGYMIQRYLLAEQAFQENNYEKLHTYLENMIPFFTDKVAVYKYYLWLGVSSFHKKAYHSAVHYFEKAHTFSPDFQLCVNLILSYEKLNKKEKILYWCEQSLRFKVDIDILQKIFELTRNESYQVQQKWSGYIYSLWNNNPEHKDWMSFHLSHGTLLSNTEFLIMQHETGIARIKKMIENMFEYAGTNHIDLTKKCGFRTTLEKLFGNLLLNSNYYETHNPTLFSHASLYKNKLPQLDLERPAPLFVKIERGSRPLRIGFLSGDLMNHPVGYMLNGILEHMDKSRFETHVFSTTNRIKDSLPIQQRMRRNAFLYYDCVDMTIGQMVNTIVEADIDVLIEMTGHTTNNEKLLEVAYHKPARVLANYFAYPNTYGIAAYDYKIGDEHVFPKGLEQYYVESFCKIDGGFHTYKPIVDLSVNKKPHTGIVFGCTNNPRKYRPEWIKAVAQILSQVPDSRIKMRYFKLDDPSICDVYYREFEKHGINRSRVDLGVGEHISGYFSSYADMDICLDPFPYNGGTINIETLYAGLPYVTLLGKNYVSRVGASILHQVGHPELIAKSVDEYVAFAVALAKDAPRLQAYKDTIRDDMMKSTLGDNAAFTRRFEDACVWMLEQKKWFTSGSAPTLTIIE